VVVLGNPPDLLGTPRRRVEDGVPVTEDRTDAGLPQGGDGGVGVPGRIYPVTMAASPDRVDALLAAWQAELPDVLGPSSELVKRIMLLAADLEEATRRVLPGFGLTVAQFDVLVTLRRAGRPYRMKPTLAAQGGRLRGTT